MLKQFFKSKPRSETPHLVSEESKEDLRTESAKLKEVIRDQYVKDEFQYILKILRYKIYKEGSSLELEELNQQIWDEFVKQLGEVINNIYPEITGPIFSNAYDRIFKSFSDSQFFKVPDEISFETEYEPSKRMGGFYTPKNEILFTDSDKRIIYTLIMSLIEYDEIFENVSLVVLLHEVFHGIARKENALLASNTTLDSSPKLQKGLGASVEELLCDLAVFEVGIVAKKSNSYNIETYTRDRILYSGSYPQSKQFLENDVNSRNYLVFARICLALAKIGFTSRQILKLILEQINNKKVQSITLEMLIQLLSDKYLALKRLNTSPIEGDMVKDSLAFRDQFTNRNQKFTLAVLSAVRQYGSRYLEGLHKIDVRESDIKELINVNRDGGDDSIEYWKVGSNGKLIEQIPNKDAISSFTETFTRYINGMYIFYNLTSSTGGEPRKTTYFLTISIHTTPMDDTSVQIEDWTKFDDSIIADTDAILKEKHLRYNQVEVSKSGYFPPSESVSSE